MTSSVDIECSCGAVAFTLSHAPIVAAECHCTSCREAASRLNALPVATQIQEPNGGTRFVLWRKDRVRCRRGEEQLGSFRLAPDATTERVVATCCNAPLYLAFKGGHWLSLYAKRWPDGVGPAPELRTMTRDLPTGTTLPDDIPNAGRQSAAFFVRLLWAWIRMGFRNPQVVEPRRELGES